MKRSWLFILPLILTLFNCEKESFERSEGEFLLKNFIASSLFIDGSDSIITDHLMREYTYDKNDNISTTKVTELGLINKTIYDLEYVYNDNSELEEIIESVYDAPDNGIFTTFVFRTNSKVTAEEYHNDILGHKSVSSFESDKVVRIDMYDYNDGIQTNHSFTTYEWLNSDVSTRRIWTHDSVLMLTTNYEYETANNPEYNTLPPYIPISEHLATKIVTVVDGHTAIDLVTYDDVSKPATTIWKNIQDGIQNEALSVNKYEYY